MCNVDKNYVKSIFVQREQLKVVGWIISSGVDCVRSDVADPLVGAGLRFAYRKKYFQYKEIF